MNVLVYATMAISVFVGALYAIPVMAVSFINILYAIY